MAELGGALMVLGGVGDLLISRLLPSHVGFLGIAAHEVPVAVEKLTLAVLHALGAALIAAGIGVLALLREARLNGRRPPLIAAGVVALVAEGMNAFQIYRTGSPVFIGPLVAVLLVVGGVVVCLAPRRGLSGDTGTVACPSGRGAGEPPEARG
jgi:hypothetical protein